MRATIAIDEELMNELMRAEKGVSRSEAVRRAVKDYVRRKRVAAFKRLAGSHIVDFDWREMRRHSVEEAQEDERRRESARGHVGVDRLSRRR
jgi:metal-responsive CopG/Arc/MetJ family transcriptional regulator